VRHDFPVELADEFFATGRLLGLQHFLENVPDFLVVLAQGIEQLVVH
jgi:hypothetical protein